MLIAFPVLPVRKSKPMHEMNEIVFEKKK
jgi:hypothetical protein